MTQTQSQKQELKEHIEAIAAILLENTPDEQLQDFASIELAVRDHITAEIAPEVGNFFKQQHSNRSR